MSTVEEKIPIIHTNGKIRYTIDILPELHAKIKNIARKKGTTMSEVVRMFLEKGIKEYENCRLQ